LNARKAIDAGATVL
jgi:hypothetical protein